MTRPSARSPASHDQAQMSVSKNQTGRDERDNESDEYSEFVVHGTDYQAYGSNDSRRPEPASDRARRQSFIEEDENALQIDIPKEKEKPVTWMSLPNKRQLCILVIARLSEPLVQSSLRSYLFYQLKSFDRSLPDSVIASQAGIMQGAFAAAQLMTAMLWGRWSDQGGRKRVLLVGLFGTMISCVGFGFSKSFWQALIFRMMGGALNGNVGVMRTMISEIVREKKFQSRAFLLLPMCANVGVIIGPMLGGLTSDLAATYPSVFGGIPWLERFPYAPPNILSAMFLTAAALVVFFGLEETHDIYSQKEDYGISMGRKVASFYRKLRGRPGEPPHDGYTVILDGEPETPALETPGPPARVKQIAPCYRSRLPFRRIFTFNVISTLVAHGLLAGCMGTFQSIWYSFLSTPVFDPEHPYPPDFEPHYPLGFTGGIGLPPRSVGVAMAILGTIGITLQLFLYPIINARIGTVRSWRIFLYAFPIVFALIPFLALIPSTTPPPSQKTGLPVWMALTGLLFIQTVGRTFATPASAILINNCSPHPTVLGTIHGIGQSASSGARTIGPAVGGWLYGVGLDHGVVGIAFWVLAIMAGVVCVASTFVREGDGHEIRLEGDDEAEEEAERANRTLLP